MNATQILEYAEQEGIHLKTEGFSLEVDAPQGLLTPDLVREITANKAGLLLELGTLIKGVSITELKNLAGDDWPELENNQTDLEHFANLVAARHMRERGEIPADYIAVTHCQGCGTVPVFAGVPETVIGCPWCFNHHSGRPVPRIL